MTTIEPIRGPLPLVLPALHRGRPIVHEHEHRWGAPWPAVNGGTVRFCEVPNCGASWHEEEWT